MTQQDAARREGPGPFWGRGRTRTNIGVLVVVFAVAFEYVGVATAMPAVSKALDGLSLYALAFAAPLATSIIGMVTAGHVTDREGPRPVILTAVGLFASGLMLCGLAPSIEVFIVGRALQGLGGGGVTVAIYVLVAQVYARAIRPRVLALMSAAWVLPGLVGPVVSGALVDGLGWRWVFLGVAPITASAVVLLWPALGRSRPEGAGEHTGISRRLGLAAAAAVATAGLHMAGADLPRLWWVALACGALVACVVPPLLPAGTFRLRPGVPSVVATRGLLAASFMAAEIYLPLVLQRVHGYNTTTAGAVLAAGAVTWWVGSTLQSRVGDAVGRDLLLRCGLVTVAVASSATVVGVWEQVPGWVLIAIWAVCGLGIGMAYPVTTLFTMALAPPSRLGQSTSALSLAESITGALLLAGTGALFNVLLQYGAIAYGAGAVLGGTVALAGVVAAVRIGEVEPGQRGPAGGRQRRRLGTS